MTDTPNRWYFDFISPFAYLQWPKVRALMQEHPIVPVPILLAAVSGCLTLRLHAAAPDRLPPPTADARISARSRTWPPSASCP